MKMENRNRSELLVSVIICTLNRPEFIKKSVKSILAQKIPNEINAEVLVIDNGCSEEIKEIIEELRYESGISRLYYVQEPCQGLHNARNTGVSYAKGDILVFIDDDAEAQECWLTTIVETYQSTDADCVIGRHQTRFIGKVPEWLEKQNIYAKKEALLGDEIKQIKKQTLIGNGLNMSMHRKVFETIGGFRALFPQRPWEDVIFFQEVQARKFKIYYNPKMKIVHYLLANRISKKKLKDDFYWGARSRCLIDKEFFKTLTILSNASKRIAFILIYPVLYFYASLFRVHHKVLLWRCFFLDAKGYLEQLVK